jgi:ligand-binding sensor domain-containing protein
VKKFFLILFLFTWSGRVCFAQSAYTPFTQFKDAILDQNTVFDILQDRTGFLWLATYNGLLRYDGYTFKSYQGDPLDSNSLFPGPAKNLCLDSSGNLWVNIQGAGIAYMNLKSGSIQRFPYNPRTKSGVHSPVILDMTLDKKGNLWMTSHENGIGKRDAKTKIFIHYAKGTRGLPNDNFTVAYCGGNGSVWVGTLNSGLYVYDEKTDSFRSFKIFSKKPGPDRKLISVIAQGRPGFILVGTDDSVARVNELTGEFKTFLKSPIGTSTGETLSLQSLLRDNKGKIWVGTFSKGLIYYDEESNKTVQFLNDPINPNSIGSNQIKKVFQDANGNLWVGCADGLSKLSPFQRQIKLYSFLKSGDGLERIRNVRAILKDDHENLWIGTAGDGLLKVSPDGNLKQYLFDLAIKQYGYNYINCITQDNHGNLLIGTGHGVHVFDPKKQKMIRSYFWDVLMPYEKRYALAVWSLKQLNDDTLLIGTKDSGLICLNLKTLAYTRYQRPGEKPETVYSIWYIYKDKDSILWLGTSGGLAQFNKKRNRWELSEIKPTGQAFPGNSIFHIHEDESGNLWLAFVDGGLVKYNKKSGQFKAFTSNEGLPSNVVCAVLEDTNKHLWISTTSGLCVLDMKEEKVIKRYTTSDGLQGNHFYFKSCTTHNNEMLFGGINGITSFFPEKLSSLSAPAAVFITSFKLLYHNVEGVRFDSTLVMPHDQNSLSLEFASNDLTNPEKNRFAYKLLGQSTDWVELKNQHYLAFNSLQPGSYSLLIKGTNADGTWGRESGLKIVIRPPFWATWWFVILCSLAALGVLMLVLLEIYKRKDAQRKQVISELTALRNQLNPHFIFNSLSSLQHFIISHQDKLALEYLTKFSRMMRMILDYSRQETISLGEEINFLRIYFYMESTRANHTISLEIDTNGVPDPGLARIPPMLIQPLIENAIIHGLVTKKPDGKINIRFKKDRAFLICEVEDNGVGRVAAAAHKPAKIGKPVALDVIRERLAMISDGKGARGSLEIIDLDGGGGTRVLLNIPYITFSKK